MAKYKFTNVKQIEKYLEKMVVIGLDEVAEITKQKLIDTVENRLYDAWTPEMYERTGWLLQSISKTKVVKVYGRYVVEIYFDTRTMQPQLRYPNWNAHADFWGEWQGDKIAKWIEEGTENRYYEHDGIWAVRDTILWIKKEFNRLFREALQYRTNLA